MFDWELQGFQTLFFSIRRFKYNKKVLNELDIAAKLVGHVLPPIHTFLYLLIAVSASDIFLAS